MVTMGAPTVEKAKNAEYAEIAFPGEHLICGGKQ